MKYPKWESDGVYWRIQGYGRVGRRNGRRVMGWRTVHMGRRKKPTRRLFDHIIAMDVLSRDLNRYEDFRLIPPNPLQKPGMTPAMYERAVQRAKRAEREASGGEVEADGQEPRRRRSRARSGAKGARR